MCPRVSKVLVTNKRTWVHQVVAFRKGRGAQEAVFAELQEPVPDGLRAGADLGGQSDLSALGDLGP